MAMSKKKCNECGRTAWHNPMGKGKDSAGGLRCTFCGFPLGTGPKKDKMAFMHAQQVAKGKVLMSKGE